MAVQYGGQIVYQNDVADIIGDTEAGFLNVFGSSVEIIDSGPNDRQIILGAGSGASGSIVVSGAGSTLRYEAQHYFSNRFQIGENGLGLVEVLNGGRFEVSATGSSGNNISVILGDDAQNSLTVADGTVLLEGNGASLSSSGSDTHTGTVLRDGGEILVQAARLATVTIAASSGLGMRSGSTLLIESGLYDASEIDSASSTLFVQEREGLSEAFVDASTVTVKAQAGEARVEIGVNPVFGGVSTPSGGLLSVARGSELNIIAASDVTTSLAELEVAKYIGSSGTLSIDASTLSMSGYDVRIDVGWGSGDGIIDLRDATVLIDAVDDAVLTLGYATTRGASGSSIVRLREGTQMDVMGDTARLNVAGTNNISALFSIESGSVARFVPQAGAASSYVIVSDSGIGKGTLAISGAGSALEIDLLYVGELFPGNPSFVDGGTMMITGGGRVDAGSLRVDWGGELLLGNSILSLNGPRYASPSGLSMFRADMKINAGASVEVEGNISLRETDVEFQIRNGKVGTLYQDSSVFSIRDQSTVTLLAEASDFERGDVHTLFDVGGQETFLGAQSETAFSVQGADDLEYAFAETLGIDHKLQFIALTDGDGSGSSNLDLDRTSTDGLIFVYDGTTGTGSGGGFDVIETTRLDKVIGTAARDIVRVEGAADIGLYGRAGDDVLRAGNGSDRLDGGVGDDVLYGFAGNDLIVGRAGDDLLAGQLGNDRLRGDAGNDILFGGQGNDRLDGGEGRDLLYGGSGADRFVFVAGDGHDTVMDFADDSDRLMLDQSLLKGLTDASAVIAAFGVESRGHSVFRFDEGERLVVRDIALVDLADDLVFF